MLWQMHSDGTLLVKVGVVESGMKGSPAGVLEVNIVVLISLPNWAALSTCCDSLAVHVLLRTGYISSGKLSGRRCFSLRRDPGGIRISWPLEVYS